jgi:hypothetical protein
MACCLVITIDLFPMADLQHKLDAVDPDRLDPHQKTQLLQACDRLRTRLESPLATASRLVFSVCRVDPVEVTGN